MRLGETLEVDSRRDWRRWLSFHHARKPEAWLVLWRKGQGPSGLTYDEAVQEATCFGWVDGTTKRLDGRRYAVRFSPRRPGSNWASSNRARAMEMFCAGRLTPAGLAALPRDLIHSYQHAVPTRRLTIVPLEAELLRLTIEHPSSAEAVLGVAPAERPAQPELVEAHWQMLEFVEQHPEAWLFYTSWQIILCCECRAIGGLCFKGPPGPDGEIEVGYGLEPPYQGKGFMQEALRAMVRWAHSQPKVSAVLAETEGDNFPSQRVLEGCGFVHSHQSGLAQWWRVDRSGHRTSARGSDHRRQQPHLAD